MRTVTRYVADPDGKEFWDEKSCVEHEAECARASAADALFSGGASLREAVRVAYADAPEWSQPKLDEAFDRVFKATKIRISHWQCSDRPVYTIERIEPYETFYVGGIGGWSGWYGNDVLARDLLRYVTADGGIE